MLASAPGRPPVWHRRPRGPTPVGRGQASGERNTV